MSDSNTLVPHSVRTGVPFADGREYEFLVTTGEPRQLEGDSRATIRRVVMRNFFNDKNADTREIPLSALNSSSTVQAGSNLKGRFRLPKPGQVTAPEKPRNPSKSREKRPSKQSAVATVPATDARQTKARTVTKRQASLHDGGHRPAADAVLVNLISISPRKNPNAHFYDPFGVFPIPGSAKVQLLFSMYRSKFRINSIAVNARNTWWPFISRDATMLHSTLASVALYSDLTTEGVTFRFEALRHKLEAIKGINAKLNSPHEGISDEVVGAVATIASFENLYGAYDAAQLHIAALKRMVAMRGGLDAFAHNDGLLRGLVWVDFHSSTAFRTPPTFPYLPPDPTSPSLPEELLVEAACSSPTNLLHLSIAGVDCFNWFYRLHRLGLATSIEWSARVDKLPLANMLYEAEFALLSMPDRSSDFLVPDRARRDGGWDASSDEAANAASVVEGLVAAGQIFLYAALREVPFRAKVFDILLARLKAAVDRPYVNIVEVWEAEGNLETLLWVLVVGTAAAKHWGGSSWWGERAVEVAQRMKVGGKEALKAMLKSVAWTDVFFGQASEEMWEDVLTVREQERAQELILDNGDGEFGSADEHDAVEREEMLTILSTDSGYSAGDFAVEKSWGLFDGY